MQASESDTVDVILQKSRKHIKKKKLLGTADLIDTLQVGFTFPSSTKFIKDTEVLGTLFTGNAKELWLKKRNQNLITLSPPQSMKIGKSKGANIFVGIRIRPLNKKEKRKKQKQVWVWDERSVERIGQQTGKKKSNLPKFTYNFCFGTDANNQDLYDNMGRNIVTECMNGYNGCIMAYGQTSSGKTHTMMGEWKKGVLELPGVIPLAVNEVFEFIEYSERQFVLRVSYIECYNETVNDLLNPKNINLKVRQRPDKSFFVQNLTEQTVLSAENILSLINSGNSHRHIGRTNYNKVSSRSHTIFRIIIESRLSSKGATRISELNLVDLAGSENVAKVGSAERKKETGAINKSLSALGQGLRYLGKDPAMKGFSVRNSKLTLLLAKCLSGKSKISLICTMSPSSGNVEQTISTLQFAARAKKIKIKPVQEEKDSTESLLVKYQSEIDQLKNELQKLRKGQGRRRSVMAGTAGGRDIAKIEKKYHREHEQLKQHIEQLTKLILRSSRRLHQPTPKGIPKTNAPTTYVPKMGDRVRYLGYDATVAYVGILPNLADLWVGLKLDKPVGKNDGTHKTIRYFKCEKKYGLFVKPSQIIKIADITPDLDHINLVAPRRGGDSPRGSRGSRRGSSTFQTISPFLFLRSESSYFTTDGGDSENESKDLDYEAEILKLEKQMAHEKEREKRNMARKKQEEFIKKENETTLNEWELFYESFQNRMPQVIERLSILREVKGLSETEEEALRTIMINFKSVTAPEKQDAISLPALSRQTSENDQNEHMQSFEDPSGSKLVIHEKAPAPLT